MVVIEGVVVGVVGVESGVVGGAAAGVGGEGVEGSSQLVLCLRHRPYRAQIGAGFEGVEWRAD